jgi:hypothetical protein
MYRHHKTCTAVLLEIGAFCFYQKQKNKRLWSLVLGKQPECLLALAALLLTPGLTGLTSLQEASTLVLHILQINEAFSSAALISYIYQPLVIESSFWNTPHVLNRSIVGRPSLAISQVHGRLTLPVSDSLMVWWPFSLRHGVCILGQAGVDCNGNNRTPHSEPEAASVGRLQT